ncbi:involucrin [Hyaena hyaena]|uniref:involucrin n=1 Tax=Hyaena hyaena TaxID=95912 RepID=UPI0019231864|nr:involucrin [Hyaena hyaena]
MSQQHTLPVTLPPELCQEPLKPVSPPINTQQEQVKHPTHLPALCQEMSSELPGEVPLGHMENHSALVKGEPEQQCAPPQLEQQPEQQQQDSQEQELCLEQHPEQHLELQEPEQHLEQQQQQESQKDEIHLEQHPEQQQQQESQEQELHLEQHLEQQKEQQQQKEQCEEHQEAKALEQQLEQVKAPTKQQEEQPTQDKKLMDEHLDGELAKGNEHLEKREEQLLEQRAEPEPAEQQGGQLKQPAFVPAPGQAQEPQLVQPLKGEVMPLTEQQQQKQEAYDPPKCN